MIFLKKLFPAQKLSFADYVFGSMLLCFCFIFFFHHDTYAIGRYSLNFLFGKPLQFYENCRFISYGGKQVLAATYPPTIYAIFALWLYPFKLFGILSNVHTFPILLVYWLKLLTTFIYGITAFIFYKTTKYFSRVDPAVKPRDDKMEKEWRKYATILWFVSPLALFSQFIFSQFDIFYVCLSLLGFFLFLQKRIFFASAMFGIAITFKYFPAFAFIPLLLFFEKKLSRIFISCVIFLIPIFLIQILYGRSPAFVAGVNNFGLINSIYASSIAVGQWHIYYLFAVFTILCGISYVLETKENQKPHAAAYIFLFSTILPFLFIFWHASWVIFFTPALILTTITHKQSDKLLFFDLVAMFFFVGLIALTFSRQMEWMFRGEEWFGLDITYRMGDLFKFFGDNSTSVFFSAFWGCLALNLILKFKYWIPRSSRGMTSFSGQTINYNNVRKLFYIGLLIFFIPVGIVSYQNYKSKYRTIGNYGAEKNYGDLTNKRTFEQSFLAMGHDIESTMLFLTTSDRENVGNVVVEIVDSNNQIVQRTQVNVSLLKDNDWNEFKFEPMKLMIGMPYKIRITSPDGQKGNAISWWATQKNQQVKGMAFVDGRPKNNDFVFKIKFVR